MELFLKYKAELRIADDAMRKFVPLLRSYMTKCGHKLPLIEDLPRNMVDVEAHFRMDITDSRSQSWIEQSQIVTVGFTIAFDRGLNTLMIFFYDTSGKMIYPPNADGPAVFDIFENHYPKIHRWFSKIYNMAPSGKNLDLDIEDAESDDIDSDDGGSNDACSNNSSVHDSAVNSDDNESSSGIDTISAVAKISVSSRSDNGQIHDLEITSGSETIDRFFVESHEPANDSRSTNIPDHVTLEITDTMTDKANEPVWWKDGMPTWLW